MRFQLIWATVCISLAPLAAHAQPFAVREDSAKLVGAESCGECHVSAYGVWKKTPHARGFDTLHRLESAEAIRDRLGLRLIKRDSPCLGCHYTATRTEDGSGRGRWRAAEGVSCESCHGAGRDYLDVHNDYGPGKDHRSETPEHRARRIEESRRAGMRRPSDLYGVASSCYGCHLVPDERLINIGGHTIGSGDFELVAWTQGEIRHNFLDSFLNGDGTVNAESDVARRRQMYVVGRAAELEHALRGVAAASGEGIYLKAMQRRVRGAVSELRAIARQGGVAEAAAMLAAVRSVTVGLGERAGLVKAADEIAAAARGFLTAYDGTALASLDPLMLGIAEDLDDAPAVAAVDAVDPSVAASPATGPSPAPDSTPATGASAASPTASPSAPTATAPRTAAVPAVGEIRRRVRPPSRFASLGPGACSRCHVEQNEWWFGDAHFASADPFFDEAPDNARIARLYGLRPADATRGDQLCMDCHGSVITGRERRSVQDGVGCESCHGPAAEYKERHQEGDKALGDRRPGYMVALGLGMTELRDPETRARTCAGCHYVTDPRLISAGHPSGRDFDYLEGMKRIRHWRRDDDVGALRPAFAAVLGERGPVPAVQRARLAGPSTPSPTATPSAADEGGVAPTVLARQLRPRPAGIVRSGGASSARGGGRDEITTPPAREIDLPPFPEIDADLPIEDILLLLEERFQLLYREVYGEP